MNATVWWFEHSLQLLFFGTGMKTDLFQSCGHCWVFQVCWHIECSTLTASSFRIWNSSAGIPSPPLLLFIVLLPKVHLTSHSKMSGSKWVTTSSWLFGSLKPFLYTSSVYSCHLFLISFVSVRSLSFLSFIMPILVWNVPLMSPIFVLFLKIFIYLCFNFWLSSVFVAAHRLSLVVISRAHSLDVRPRVLIVVASLLTEHGL